MADAATSTSTSTCTSGPTQGQKTLYAIPSRLQSIASSHDINDASEPMRIGQITVFVQARDPDGKLGWLGITIAHIFSPSWKLFNSAPVFNEDPNILKGDKAYEVTVKQPCNSDYTTDRTRVTLTGRTIGETIGVGQGNAMAYVKMEKLTVSTFGSSKEWPGYARKSYELATFGL